MKTKLKNAHPCCIPMVLKTAIKSATGKDLASPGDYCVAVWYENEMFIVEFLVQTHDFDSDAGHNRELVSKNQVTEREDATE